MAQTTTSARHRASRRPLTAALTGTAARRSAAAVASSGIVLTLTASAGMAAPGGPENTDAAAGGRVLDDVTSAPTVTVAADLNWSFTATAVSSEAPPPPPPPPVEVRNTSASRTADRTAVTTPTKKKTTKKKTTQQAAAANTGGNDQAAEAPAAEKPAAEAPAQAASGSAIVDVARRYVGTPYKSGGSTPAAFDCSGFTQYVFKQFGINLPRSSSAQRYAGTVVSASEARPGDLVWWPGHVGIYTGNGNHIAARNPSTALYESKLFRANPTFIRVG